MITYDELLDDIVVFVMAAEGSIDLPEGIDEIEFAEAIVHHADTLVQLQGSWGRVVADARAFLAAV